MMRIFKNKSYLFTSRNKKINFCITCNSDPNENSLLDVVVEKDFKIIKNLFGDTWSVTSFLEINLSVFLGFRMILIEFILMKLIIYKILKQFFFDINCIISDFDNNSLKILCSDNSKFKIIQSLNQHSSKVNSLLKLKN